MVSNTAKAWLIGTLTFISYAYFYQGGGWNPNSRFDLVRAIIERHTLSIDAYQENTGDKAFYRGHYYSDKAPGQVLPALPAAAATRAVLQLAGKDPTSPRALIEISYFAGLLSVAFPAALGCVCVFLISLRLDASSGAAAIAAIAMGLGTPMWAYATLFFGHSLAAACLLIALLAALKLRSEDPWVLSFVIGVAASWAVVTEYPAAPAAVIVGGLALASVWRDGASERFRVVCGMLAGAVPCVLILAAYQWAAFGSPWRLGYSQYPAGSFTWMRHGLLGLTYPHPLVALKLLFGSRRGLFFASPIAAVGVAGLWRLAKSREHRVPAFAAAGIFVYYLLFNAAFPVWTAGWSYGPRYMAAGIPMLCLGIAPAWDFFRGCGKKVLVALLCVSLLFCLIAVATQANPPDTYRSPITQLLWPSFWHGHLALNSGSMLTPAEDGGTHAYGAFNIGQLVGLRGLASLLPLLVLWIVTGLIWRRMRIQRKETHSSHG